MKIKRVIANVLTANPSDADRFYGNLLGMKVVMDQGWIRTYGASEKMPVQISFASQGGSDTLLPDISIEVDNLVEALDRIHKANIPIEYGPVHEPWGVQRFFVRDPFGKLINILQHDRVHLD
jgi:catechol 2,3-dioxygenase-like lactoylglutathione lyase family enzyme